MSILKKKSRFTLIPLFVFQLCWVNLAQAEKVNGEKKISANIQGVVYLINLMLKSPEELPPIILKLADVNGDNSVNIQDVVHLINRILKTPEKVSYSALNDTGITSCANDREDGQGCPLEGFPNQDAQHGRDATHNDDTDGHAGFSFTKLDSAGNALSATGTEWSCVKDNITGLVWEVKTDDGGLRDKGWEYTWYNSSGINDGGAAGVANGGTCFDTTHCDTEKFVQQVNNQGLCGYHDWRMPTISELENIASLDRLAPAIDKDYFPNIVGAPFWSASSVSSHSIYSNDSAWGVDFYNGDSDFAGKIYSTLVRLVRTGQ